MARWRTIIVDKNDFSEHAQSIGIWEEIREAAGIDDEPEIGQSVSLTIAKAEVEE